MPKIWFLESAQVRANDKNTTLLQVVPKALADVLEALVGAVFVDSGLDLKKTWEIFEPLLRPAIAFYSSNIPLNSVAKIHEHYDLEFL